MRYWSHKRAASSSAVLISHSKTKRRASHKPTVNDLLAHQRTGHFYFATLNNQKFHSFSTSPEDTETNQKDTIDDEQTAKKTAGTSTKQTIKYLNQLEAQNIDIELFSEYRYSVDQLMELAGLAVAIATENCYPLKSLENKTRKILIICGPGNNGGDGLVAARHLKHFGYHPEIYYPKRPQKELFANLTFQCQEVGINFLEDLPTPTNLSQMYNLVIDGIFGFSFKGNAMPPFDAAVDTMKNISIPIVSIDIPSGWDVELGNPSGIQPDCLISLTAPKRCAKGFNGKHHYLAGRFVPETLSNKFNLNLPPFPGSDCVVKL